MRVFCIPKRRYVFINETKFYPITEEFHKKGDTSYIFIHKLHRISGDHLHNDSGKKFRVMDFKKILIFVSVYTECKSGLIFLPRNKTYQGNGHEMKVIVFL